MPNRGHETVAHLLDDEVDMRFGAGWDEWNGGEAWGSCIPGPDGCGYTVMSSLIHEARGIIYFNHNFGGPCHTQHVLRDRNCTNTWPNRAAVIETNQRIRALARVLNTQSYEWEANSGMDTMLKAYDGSYYLFAMPSRSTGTGNQTLRLPDGIDASQAEVMFEDRAVPITGGALSDTFPAEHSYHIYKITP